MTTYTIVGTPFSTFTRSITLALRFKGIPYKQIRTTPHSDIADAHHPFGYLPTLIIHGDNGDTLLRESQAIVRYIDRTKPTPTLHLEATEGGPLPEKMWEFVSLVAAFGFQAVEIGVVKLRVKAIDEGKPSDAELREKIKGGVSELKNFLAEMENLMAPSGYAFGDKVTWADFYLFPLLADLRAIPEGEVLSPRLLNWMKAMDETNEVKATAEGTLSVGARP